MPLAYTCPYGNKWEIANEANLPPQSLQYLLSQGFKPSMTDAAAMSKDRAAKIVEEHAKALGVTVADLSDEDKRDAMNVATKAMRDKRFAAINDGTVGEITRAVGPRLDPVAKFVHAIAVERLRAICDGANPKGVKLPLPKGDHYKAAIAKIIAKGGEDMVTEARKRHADANAGGDDVLSDLGL
jgi:hypothetical protein